MDDLKVYLDNQNDQREVVDFIEFNYPEADICTWDPDPEDTGSWGMWIDGVDESIWDRLIEVYGDGEDLEGSFEMALGGGEKEYPWFFGSVAESVDAPDLKSVEKYLVGVQVPPLLSPKYA